MNPRDEQLVRQMAGHLCRRLPSSEDVDDIIQDGLIGLTKATAASDPARGVSFRTFARHRIRGAMRDGLRERDPVTRRGRERGIAPKFVSLHAPVPRDHGGVAIAAQLLDRRPDPATSVAEAARVDEMTAGLDERSRLIVRLYVIDGHLFKAIGRLMRLSETRVCQLYHEAIRRLRADQLTA